jgi:hypothetical protein
MNNETVGDDFSQLESWIGASEESPWDEYSAELSAKTVLYKFKSKDWEKLESDILTKPKYWQERCIASLGHNRSEAAIGIIKKTLLQSPHIDIRIMAIYELDWANATIERKYIKPIEDVICSLSEEEIEPELTSLLAKAKASTN